MIANLPMGGNKITGMADPTLATDATTKNYVDNSVSSFFSTGDVKLTLKTTPDSGWLLMNDTTFGSLTSGATTQNNATQALFTLLFNVTADADVPLFTSSGVSTTRAAQGSPSAAWAANCRMSLPKSLGRALAISGAGAGLSGRALGSTVGEENHLLSTNEMPSHYHSASIQDLGHQHSFSAAQFAAGSFGISGSSAQQVNIATSATASATTGVRVTSLNGTDTTNSAGGGAVHNNMQPSVFLNCMVKL